MWDKLGWVNWFWQFLCEGLSSFNLKRFYYSYAWSCSLCERRTSFCMRVISRKLCGLLLIFSTSFTLVSVLLLFLYRSPSSLLCTIFDSVSPDIDEVLPINPSANLFVFGDFNINHKDWLTYSGETDRPGELSDNFSISNDFTQIVNFPTWIPDCDSQSPALLDSFLSSDASICSIMAFPSLGNSDHVVCPSFHWLFNKLETGFPISPCGLWLFLRWLRRSSWSFERRPMGGYL